MRVLVLGAYGFIGLELARRVASAGHEVFGLGRSAALGRRLLPAATWFEDDIATLSTPESWGEHLESVDVVINAAGALQSGYADNVQAIHHGAISALVSACEASGVNQFIQISAVGASTQADTLFMRSKGFGDECVSQSKLEWLILRPGLVLGQNAYGGSALLRAIASTPWVQPVVRGKARMQCVAIDDICAVVLEALDGRITQRVTLDLVESRPHTLEEITHSVRRWLGHSSAPTLNVPDWLGVGIAKVADVLGHLGWRSPARSTALSVLTQNILGNPEPLTAMRGQALKSLDQTLADMPSTLQERWFGRLYLLLPVAVTVLSLFWITSGIVALFNISAAAQQSGLADGMAHAAVYSGALLDIGLGMGILFRPWSRLACWGMLLVSVGYLALGSILVPMLWTDPLGPLVKIVPSMMLVGLVLAMLEARR